eukprot:Nk52_evm57s210 gene=Nk52_evmTU57s210
MTSLLQRNGEAISGPQLKKVEIPSSLSKKINEFKLSAETYLAAYKRDPSKITLASALLISDNVIVDLFARFTDFMPTVVAIDTLHLFPETLQLARDLETKYKIELKVFQPKECETLKDFEEKYGTHQDLSHADFDFHSKIEPLQRSFGVTNKEVLITGRRSDQGNERVHLDVWEEDKKNFNPLAGWTWDDVCTYVLEFGVPYNALHRRVAISDTYVAPLERYTYPFRYVNLEKPFFAYDFQYILSLGSFVYVWKSFGDTHTSIMIPPQDSERSGRFVGRQQTECGIHTRMAHRGAPHGGKLVDLMVASESEKENLLKLCGSKRIELTERQACDFELISNGGFSPLTGFMNETSYLSVCEDMRLPEGQLFGLPVTLDTDNEEFKVGDYVFLDDQKMGGKGVIHIESKYIPERKMEGLKVYGTESEDHPSVYHLLNEKLKYNIGGRVYCFKLPNRDWVTCKTPKQVRAEMQERGVKNLIAFQSRNPLHKAHVSMFLRVAKENDADVLVHPVVGPTKSDDVPADVRKQTYDVLAKKLTHVYFEYLPYSMMVGGPREALQHTLIRKNYGCTGIIIGRDHAGCKSRSTGEDFYGPYDAQEMMKPLMKELVMDMISFQAMAYAEEVNEYLPANEVQEKGYHSKNISGTKFRKMMVDGEEIPEWFAYPEVVSVLRSFYSGTSTER